MFQLTFLRCVPRFKLNKPECVYGSTVCKCPISSQTIKYRYKFKSNQKILLTKNACMDPLKVCTKFQVSRTSLSQKNLTNRRSSRSSWSRNGHDKSRGSNLISNSSRTNKPVFDVVFIFQ